MSTALPPDSDQTLATEVMEVGLQVARVGLGTVDYVGDTLRLDALCAELFELPAGQDIPRDTLHQRIHPDDWPSIQAEVDVLLNPQDTDVLDMTHRILTPSGTLRWVNARKRIYFDRSGDRHTAQSGVFAVVDVTETVEAKHREQILIGELRHRAKNLFTVVLGIVEQLKRHATKDAFPDRFRKRIEALSRNQDALVTGAGGAYDLRSVIDQQLLPFEGQTGARVTVNGQTFPVSSNAAQTIAMVTYELLTNATKYGALANSSGTVSVVLAVDDTSDTFQFTWIENGGPSVVPPTQNGFGTRVLESFATLSLNAQTTLEYKSGGLCYALVAPLSRLLPEQAHSA